ncbi:uncharacterized protein HD556DRAFT_1314666 [Suillus plorans]|uniref:Uncharacterized protein n=1 Tax=Suillus plorans TaxID=116603 RepID=A0A9P7AA62_9AGAM|nr:uncharacterized protein HD556DRAFT_1314666 [Suillus plorans]KAG1784933.1 hypothetical protein HD556DRAFT_1314666 [Suillus plorans]
MAPLLTRVGPRRFTLPNGLGDGDLLIVLDMLRTYLEHDAHLRSGTASGRATPAGYGDFALSFNMMQTTNGHTSRIAEESTEGPRISGPSPSFIDLVGEDTTAAVQANSSQPPPPEGGRWINPRRAELLEEALWMNLETSKRQREWRDRSIADRKAAKRARHTASAPPTNPTMTHGEGSSRALTFSPTLNNNSPRTRSPHTAGTRARMEVDDEDETAPQTGRRVGDETGKEAAKRKKIKVLGSDRVQMKFTECSRPGYSQEPGPLQFSQLQLGWYLVTIARENTLRCAAI